MGKDGSDGSRSDVVVRSPRYPVEQCGQIIGVEAGCEGSARQQRRLFVVDKAPQSEGAGEKRWKQEGGERRKRPPPLPIRPRASDDLQRAELTCLVQIRPDFA